MDERGFHFRTAQKACHYLPEPWTVGFLRDGCPDRLMKTRRS